MNQQPHQAELAAASARALKIKWLIVVGMLLLAAVLILAMPRGYNDDLAQIGKGKPVAVLVHNKNSMASLDLMHAVDGLRAEYYGKLDFLVADVNTDSGGRFAAEQVPPPALVLFDAAGAKLKVLGTSDLAALRKELNITYNLAQP